MRSLWGRHLIRDHSLSLRRQRRTSRTDASAKPKTPIEWRRRDGSINMISMSIEVHDGGSDRPVIESLSFRARQCPKARPRGHASPGSPSFQTNPCYAWNRREGFRPRARVRHACSRKGRCPDRKLFFGTWISTSSAASVHLLAKCSCPCVRSNVCVHCCPELIMPQRCCVDSVESTRILESSCPTHRFGQLWGGLAGLSGRSPDNRTKRCIGQSNPGRPVCH